MELREELSQAEAQLSDCRGQLAHWRSAAQRSALLAAQRRAELRAEPRPLAPAADELRLAEALRQEAFVAARDAEGFRRAAVERAQALVEANMLLESCEIEAGEAFRRRRPSIFHVNVFSTFWVPVEPGEVSVASPVRGALVFEERLALELRQELRCEESRAQVGRIFDVSHVPL